MNIINILEAIEKLAVELLLWIVYVPKTLYKVIADPGWVPGYVEGQLANDKGRFEDYMSPVLLFLVCSVFLFVFQDQMAIGRWGPAPSGGSGGESEVLGTAAEPERGVVDESKASAAGDTVSPAEPDTSSTRGGAWEDGANKSLEALQQDQGIALALAFLGLPLLLSIAARIFHPEMLSREEIKRLLYIQCFYCAPLTLALFSLWLFGAVHNFRDSSEAYVAILISVLCLVIFLWFGIVEIRLIKRERQWGTFKAIANLMGTFLFIVVSGGLAGLIFLSGDVVNTGGAGRVETVDVFLPADGQYGIIVSGSSGSAGSYRLDLSRLNKNGELQDEPLHPREDVPGGSRLLVYGDSAHGTVRENDAVKWTFFGVTEERIHVKVTPERNFDVAVDVRDEYKQTVRQRFTAVETVGWLYVLFLGWALVKGFFSLRRKDSTTRGDAEESTKVASPADADV